MATSNVKLIVDAASATKALTKVNSETQKLGKTVKDLNGRLHDSKGRFVAMGKEATRAKKGVQGFGGALKQLIAAAAAFQALKFIVVKTAELETQTRSLTVLTGSLETAKNVIQELQEFGSVTPFTSTELIETAKRLKAFGVETNKIVETTKRLGDIAGATGSDLTGIATAYGQIQAKGRLQGEELLQLQERGINLQGELQDMYKMTGEEFRKALEGGKFSAKAVEVALNNLTSTGGTYANGAIAQSDTLAGKFSTLTDNITRLAQIIGNVLKPVISDILDLANAALNEIRAMMEGASMAQKLGLNQKQLNAVDAEAYKRASQIADLRGYGPLDSIKQALLQQQIAQDILKLQGYESGLLQLPADKPKTSSLATEVPELLGKTSSGTGGTTAKIKEQKDITAEMLQLNYDINAAKIDGLEHVKIAKSLELDILKIQEKALPANKEAAAIDNARTARLMEFQKLLSPIIDGAVELQEAARDAGEAFAQLYIDADDAKIKELGEKMNTLYASIGQTIQTGIVDSLTAAVDGTKELADVASDTLRQVANILLQFGVSTALGAIPGLDKFFPGRAKGGSVMGGKSYLVGEKGPELFTPGRSGSIAPSGSFNGSNMTINVDASGSSVQGDQPSAKALGAAIGAAVQSELVKQKRPGGLLS
ncbi:MAG: hypothetical protein Unbinned1819contig1001_15 [Prokaryotic dsDNA virus sp.]|nr:MAG: hypothetical protein Unbinned1819contig1001_15 [Prokaryotic dsDNA virus sp.]|tara:strand:+ start:1851 stop:3815 length:1965 start_codon:yes stop_codon:yes gene_type:complete